MERAYIIINKNLLPSDTDPDKPTGIRLGVQELTRMGMKESEMKEVAALIKKVVMEGTAEKVIKDEVIEMRKGFQDVQYCFDGKGAYNFPELKIDEYL